MLTKCCLQLVHVSKKAPANEVVNTLGNKVDMAKFLKLEVDADDVKKLIYLMELTNERLIKLQKDRPRGCC